MEFKDKVVVVTGGAKEGLYLASDKEGFVTGENICIDMHLRRSRQVPRRAKRGALQGKVARGCAA